MISFFRGITAGCLLVAASIATAPVAHAAVLGIDLGTSAPPGTLGGYTMTPFGADTRDNFSNVTSVASPLGGDVIFDSSVSKREIGSGWLTWSHGYTGPVYYDETGTSLTLSLPSLTSAFYLYTQPTSFDAFSFTVMDSTGTSFTTDIDGEGGANGFGFWGTAGSTLTSITVSTEAAANGFAVGEFGIAEMAPIPVPASGFLLIAGIGAIGVLRRRRAAVR